MIWKRIAALAAILTALAAQLSSPVLADGMQAAKPAAKAVRLHVDYHYVRGLWPGGPDPYAYSYKRPGYYPYYNSRYWVPRKQMKARTRYPMRIPEYYSSWGYPIACKIHGRAKCGVPFKKPAGDPRHYYRRDVQLNQGHQHN